MEMWFLGYQAPKWVLRPWGVVNPMHMVKTFSFLTFKKIRLVFIFQFLSPRPSSPHLRESAKQKRLRSLFRFLLSQFSHRKSSKLFVFFRPPGYRSYSGVFLLLLLPLLSSISMPLFLSSSPISFSSLSKSLQTFPTENFSRNFFNRKFLLNTWPPLSIYATTTVVHALGPTCQVHLV